MSIITGKLDAAGAAAFHADALAALSIRAGLAVANPSEQQLRIARAPLSALMTASLVGQGFTIDPYGSPAMEDLFDAAFTGCEGKRQIVGDGGPLVGLGIRAGE